MRFSTHCLSGIFVTVFGLTGPVWAGCPVKEDLVTGIRFTLETGETETFKRLSDGNIESFFHFGEGDGVRTVLAQGVYILRTQDVNGGQPRPEFVTYDYDTDPSALAPLAVGETRRVSYQALAGAKLEKEIGFLTPGAPFEKSYGACRFEVWPVEGVTHPGANLESYHYLPALGVSYIASFADGKETSFYNYVSIDVVK